MSLLESNGEDFYWYAMDYFFHAGHAATSEPEYRNHSPEQFVYFDNTSDLSLSQKQRALLGAFHHVSRLFSFNGCVFLSINLLTERKTRSQTAHDIHTMIHPIIESSGSVCLFRCDDEMMLSFMGYGFRCILSDWYPINDDSGCFLERLDSSNMSIHREKDYFLDMIYALARSYYLSSSNPNVYELLPKDFVVILDCEKVDREELRQVVEYERSVHQRIYGDDYVEYDESAILHAEDISAEFDLMLLEIDDEDDIDDLFRDELESEDDAYFEEENQEEYAFHDFDPEIFKDPTLMVKFLNKAFGDDASQ